jgi:anaerobic C4-dicarboxylate transporter DcuA
MSISVSALLYICHNFNEISTAMFWLELLVVLLAIFLGARIGGIGLGVMGALGLAVLVFVFGLQPSVPPVDVMLMIVAVVTAAGALQAAGGLDYLVHLAEKMLRKNPKQITFYGPLVTYLFTIVAGTGHVSYSVLPVIAEVATDTRVRPERPMSIAVIASQQGITASPISAATVALLGMLSPFGYTLTDILMVAIPSTLVGVFAGALFASRMGKELDKDPEFLAKLEDGSFSFLAKKPDHEVVIPFTAKLSVYLFLLGTILIVLFGSVESLRPSWESNGVKTMLGMPEAIEVIMLSIAAAILLFCKASVDKTVKGSVFIAGVQAVIAIFGIAWMGDTFFKGNMPFLEAGLKSMVTAYPWLFSFALFVLSILLYSQAATVRALVPFGLGLGIPAASMIGMFPSVNGYFFIPNYPTIVAAINFDRTGTTRIGRWVLNHSFMIPGLVATVVAVAIGLLLTSIIF